MFLFPIPTQHFPFLFSFPNYTMSFSHSIGIPMRKIAMPNSRSRFRDCALYPLHHEKLKVVTQCLTRLDVIIGQLIHTPVVVLLTAGVEDRAVAVVLALMPTILAPQKNFLMLFVICRHCVYALKITSHSSG